MSIINDKNRIKIETTELAGKTNALVRLTQQLDNKATYLVLNKDVYNYNNIIFDFYNDRVANSDVVFEQLYNFNLDMQINVSGPFKSITSTLNKVPDQDSSESVFTGSLSADDYYRKIDFKALLLDNIIDKNIVSVEALPNQTIKVNLSADFITTLYDAEDYLNEINVGEKHSYFSPVQLFETRKINTDTGEEIIGHIDLHLNEDGSSYFYINDFNDLTISYMIPADKSLVLSPDGITYISRAAFFNSKFTRRLSKLRKPIISHFDIINNVGTVTIQKDNLFDKILITGENDFGEVIHEVHSIKTNNTFKLNKKGLVGKWSIKAQGLPNSLYKTETFSETLNDDTQHVIERSTEFVYYIESDLSDIVDSIGRIKDPIISLSPDGLSFSWNKIDVATSYNIYDQDVLLSKTTDTSYNIPKSQRNVGMHLYNVIPVYGNNTSYSVMSNILDVRYENIETPAINWEVWSNNLHISNIPHVDRYDILYGNYIDESSVANQAYSLNNQIAVPNTVYDDKFELDQVNKVVVQVRVYSDKYRFEDEHYNVYYNTNNITNKLIYNKKRVASPVIQYNHLNSTIGWMVVPFAKDYSVYINDQLKTTSTDLNYTITDVYSNAVAYVIANPVDFSISADTYNVYINSKKSNFISFGKLDTPVLTGSENKIEWQPIENAKSYNVYNYGELVDNVNTLEYYADSKKQETFRLTVSAVSDDPSIENSNESNIIEITFTKLPAPEITFNKLNNTVTLDPKLYGYDVDKTKISYRYFVNNYIYKETQDTSIVLDENIKGSTSVYAETTSSTPIYVESDKSNILYLTLGTVQKHVLKVYDTTSANRFEKTYDIQLPIDLSFTLDESLDTGSVILSAISDSRPFEPFTECEIQIYADDGSGNLASNQSFSMMIETDKVIEVKVGPAIKYKHVLTLIENTKILESVYIPSMTVTQPKGYVETLYNKATALYEVAPSQEIIKNNCLANWYSLDGGYVNTDIYLMDVTADNINVTSIPSNVIQIGEEVMLPKLNTKSITTVERVSRYFTAFNAFVQTINIDDLYSVHFIKGLVDPKFHHYNNKKVYNNFNEQWWVIKNDDVTYNENGASIIHSKKTYDELVNIAKTTNPSVTGTSENTVKYKFNQKGVYDIVFHIDNFLLDHSIESGIGGSFQEFNPPVYPWGEKKDPIIFGFGATNRNSLFGAESKRYNEDLYIVFRDVQILDKQIYAAPQAEYLSKNVQTVTDVIDKVLKIAKPLKWKNGLGIIDSQQFVLDNDIRELLDTRGLVSPEFTWDGGKSLYEILTDIGREFSGIPRLLRSKYNSSTGSIDNNVITFDILSVNQNTTPIDTFSLSEIKTTTENNTTSYISPVSNMISTEDEEIYPSKYSWVSAKSSDINNPYVMRNNMAIVLPKPIARLNSIKVAVLNEKNEPEPLNVDLIDYTVEETIFNTLNDDANGKGKSLFWIQGDNKIQNLGAIIAQTEAEYVFGLESSKYTIQNIIKSATGLDVDTQKLVFKVSYVPYSNMTINTEKSNVANTSKWTSKILNQDNNTITDVRFGYAAQHQISRLGTETVTKSYKNRSILNVPQLGQTIVLNSTTYYCDSINHSINNNYITSTCEFSKDYNKINDRMGVDSEYRQYQISADEYVERNINIDNYCYVSHLKYDDCKTDIQTKCKYSLSNILKASLNNNPYSKPEVFYISAWTNTENDDNTVSRLKYTEYRSTELNNKNTSGFVVPANIYYFSNSVLFTGKMYDNFSAGIKADTEEKDPGIITFDKDKIGKYKQQECRYVDDLGKADVFNITLGTVSNDSLYSGDYAEYSKYRSVPSVLFTSTPEAYMNSKAVINSSNPLTSAMYYINKDSREAFTFNYQLHFLTYDKNITIHRALSKYLFMKKNNAIDIKPQFVACTEYINTLSVLPNKGEYQVIGDATISSPSGESNIIYITCDKFVANRNYKSLALVWPDTQEIILSEKKDMNKGETIITSRFILNISDDKIDTKVK